MEETKVKDYLYDYKKSSFKTVNNSGKKNYYIKINQDYIEITEDVYKTCKSSYDKLRYTYKQEVAHSVSHYEDMDIATSFCLHQNVSAINKLLLKDLTSTIYSEIDQLNSTDRKIAILFFIYEYNISEISRILDLPRKTVTYRKIRFKNICKKLLKIFATLMVSFHVFK